MENLEVFADRLKTIRKQAIADTGLKDYYHMRAIDWLGKTLFLAAIPLCYYQWYLPCILVLAFSLMIKWLLMHHIGHGGYDRIKGIPRRFHSSHYALGYRKYLDWFDWIKPEAWNYEHNTLHHAHTGELEDPDLVEENLSWLAAAPLPLPIKALVLTVFALTWKFTYYSARTLSFNREKSQQQMISFANFLDLRGSGQRTLWFELFIPYVAFNFLLLPVLLEWFIPGIGLPFLYCRIGAELLHNLHTFIIIVPNHSGEDLHRFLNVQPSERGGGHFYLRQILGSVNYKTGNEWLDLSQMYLNYQIEHHLFPNLSMRQYRKIQPQVKALCHEFGINYIQESVWVRFVKMCRIALGTHRMIRVNYKAAS